MIDKIQAFGDSFTAGDDLKDPRATWTALIADRLGLDYEVHALGGRGNHRIADDVIGRCHQHSLVIVNWTWIDRFDWYLTQGEIVNHQRTIRPSNDDTISKFYYKNIHSETSDKFHTAMYIWGAMSWLKQRNIPQMHTVLDRLLFDDTWNRSLATVDLNDHIRKNITWFPEQQTFLEWSRDNGFAESDNWHPLDEAHARAADIMLPVVEKAINTHIK